MMRRSGKGKINIVFEHLFIFSLMTICTFKWIALLLLNRDLLLLSLYLQVPRDLLDPVAPPVRCVLGYPDHAPALLRPVLRPPVLSPHVSRHAPLLPAERSPATR